MSSKLNSFGKFDGDEAICSLRYNKGNRIVGIEVYVGAALAHVDVLLQTRSSVVQVSEKDRIDDLVIMNQPDHVWQRIVETEYCIVVGIAFGSSLLDLHLEL